ncbi:hypothetical protein Bhyg_01380 [Pseudolycoriella hygida]|uniref:Uncharacterized protein n=1 Tax=Pseudolycoriella hygida TaxID=35572 RepID=A0A9Q0N9J4_9DIPT|nr:hypothetical protein Bhyg_01380 [Pseudolycoriella hygida]
MIRSGKYFDVSAFRFSGVFSTMDFVNKNPAFSDDLRRWLSMLNELNPERDRSTDLAKHFRALGNELFDEPDEPYDIAADYYTKAIYSAPKGSEELALAHANRAACCYHDCEMALKMNYPMNKRGKLLLLKFYLAENVHQREVTLREIEDLVEQKLVSDEQMKLPKLRELLKDMQNGAAESTVQRPMEDTFESKQMIE